MNSTNHRTVQWITPQCQLPPGIHALTTCRDGGVSKPPWSALNLALHVGDNPASVLRNRQLLIEAARLPAEPVWLNQQHGNRVVRADRGTPTTHYDADACFTDQPSEVCAVLTADCLPVLICDIDGNEMAAIHAGWRGLAAGIIAETLGSFTQSSHRLIAWIGPAISAPHYAVDATMRDRFLSLDQDYEKSFTATTKKGARHQWLMDLAAIASLQLKKAGVERITPSGVCCYADPRFYSHRRDPGTGRMATLIWRTCVI